MTDPATLFDRGNALFEVGRTEAAIDAFQRCLDIVPNHSGVRYNLGNALLKAGRTIEAVEAFQTCLRLDPQFGPAYVNLANALRQLALLEPAQMMAELGMRYLPNGPDAKICLANVLYEKADYASAVLLYRQVLAAAPEYAGVRSSLGNALRAMGDFPAALAAHEQAITAAPDDPEFRYNKAMTLLAAGDYDHGWDEYEWRWRCPRRKPRDFGEAWRGEDIQGRTILLHAEQGLGDTLQFARYAPMVAARGARVVLEVQPPLVSLMRQLPGIEQVVAQGQALPPFDVHCPLLSLPRAFGTTLGTIPAALPYLHANAASVAVWNDKLPAGGLRVGLVWAGSPHTDNVHSYLIDQRRSLGAGQLAPLADVPWVHLISLQKDKPDRPSGLTLIDPMPEVTDFADTAALVANLDLVVSVDTAVAHLAGALGRPVWLLARYNGCWRWLDGRDDSPWYPGMRIYRQERPHDWTPVVERIRSDLRARAQCHHRMTGLSETSKARDVRNGSNSESGRVVPPE